MAKEFVTAHIKLESHEFASLARHAENCDLSAAQLVRKILRGWLDGQVYVGNTEEGPVTAQSEGHVGYVATNPTQSYRGFRINDRVQVAPNHERWPGLDAGKRGTVTGLFPLRARLDGESTSFEWDADQLTHI